MKLNLHTKLIGNFIVVLFLMIVVGLVSMYTSMTIQTRLEDTVEQDVKSASILGVVARRVCFIHSNSLLHLATRSIDDITRYESEIADWAGKISTNLDILENICKYQAILDKLAEFRVAWETYLKIWNEQVVPLSRANQDEQAFALIRKKGAAGIAAREAMYKLDELHDASVAIANYNLESAEQDLKKSQNILLAVILFAIILGLAFAVRQSSLIAGAMNTVSKAAQLMATGDLNQSVMVRTGDEIESMADSFNTMTSNMKKMVEELQHEITERKGAEALIREQNERLKELDRMKSEFLSTAAHELRTPLTSILGFSEILLKGKLDKKKQVKFLKIVNKESEGLANIINDLLDVSSIESGRDFEIKKASVEFKDIILENVDIFQEQTDKHTFKVNIPHDLAKIEADKDKINQVMENLISNAVKFSPQGGEITVSIEQSEEKAKISITDSGIGIPGKDLPHIFEKFYRADNASRAAIGGTGLGLSIAKYIVESHAGRIWAESKLGKGSTFSFTLPLESTQARTERKEEP